MTRRISKLFRVSSAMDATGPLEGAGAEIAAAAAATGTGAAFEAGEPEGKIRRRRELLLRP